MRESLTVLAILLIVVLTTALVGPYFIDWNAHRGEVEARLSDLLGARVAVAGPIDLKLLPRPILRMQQVRFQGDKPGDGRLSADRLDVELTLTAVLRGDIEFADAEITRPHLALTVAPDRSVILPSFGATHPSRVSIVRLTVHDGTLALNAADGTAITALTGLEGEGDADTLAGPFKFAGHVDTPRGSLDFRVATGTYEGGRMRLKSTFDPMPGFPKTDVEGILTRAGTAADSSAVTFDGTVAANGQLPFPDGSAAVPWQASTRLHAEAGQVAFNDVSLRAGADGRAVILDGDGVLPLTGAVAARFTLRARELDALRLAVPTDRDDAVGDADATGIPRKGTLADLAGPVGALARNPDAFAALPVPVTVDLGVGTVLLGPETLTGAGGVLTFAAGRPVTGTLAVDAPEGTHLGLDGSFEPGSAAVFKGRVRVATRNVAHWADAVAADLPDAAAWVRSVPASRIDFTATADLSSVGFAAHDVDLALDRSRFAGTLTLTRAVGAERPRFFADLTSEALDLDALPAWRGAAATLSGLDLALTLSARAVRLARTDLGTVEAGHITLQLSKAGPVVTLDRLSLADLGGATAELAGRSDGRMAHAAGRFDVRKLADLAALIDRIAPGPVTDALAARADVLSPALLQVAADAVVEADGTMRPTAVTVDGTAAGTRVSLRLQPERSLVQPGGGPVPLRAGQDPFAVALTLDAAESGALLRQLGLVTPPATAIGHGRVAASARLNAAGALDGIAAEAQLGDTALSFKGRGGPGPAGFGRLGIRGPNLAPVLRALSIASPAPGAAWPVEAEADLTWRDGRLVATGLAGRLIGTAFSGSLAYAAGGVTAGPGGIAVPQTPAALTGTLKVDQLSLPVLVGLALGPVPQPKAGAVWPDAPFAQAFLTLPRTELALTVPALAWSPDAVLRNARMTLRLAPGLVTLADMAAGLGRDGSLDGTLAVRRDGAAASVAGHLAWTGLPLTSPSLNGRSQGRLDFAGTGGSVAALVGGLAGSGELQIDDARLPGFDPDAIGRVVKTTDAATDATADADEMTQAVERELGRGALALGTLKAPLTVATGVLRADPVKVDGPGATTEVTGSLDLRTLALSLRATAMAASLPPDWSGAAPQITATWKGPFASPTRAVDATALVNGLAARAIARDQARIEAFQDDIRERAFFARRLKAIEAEQQEQARASADAERQNLLQSIRPAGRPANAPPAGQAPDAKAGPAGGRAGDAISRLLDGGKPGPASAPPPSPRPKPRSGNPGAPLDLQPSRPAEAAAP